MTRFRPCIDLHAGQVKQIVGGSLSSESSALQTNHVSEESPAYFANLYRESDLTGGHVIMLGPGNQAAAEEALRTWPDGLQVGGGINPQNAQQWIDKGASKVIVTSYLFPEATFSMEHLKAVLSALKEGPQRLVIDLSCRRRKDTWVVAMDKWQTLTDMEISNATIQLLEPYCAEFLIHAADNEGLQRGIDEDLVQNLGNWCSIPVTYAGGGKGVEDLDKVQRLSDGRVDLTIGSALDIFGGRTALDDCVQWNQSNLNS